VMPDQDAALAITAETADMQSEIDLVWKYLLPAFKNGKLPDDKSADLKLHEMIKTLALPVPAENKEGIQSSLNGKTFMVESNKMQLQQIGFDFAGDVCKVKLQTGKGNYQFNFGAGKWQFGETNMPGPSLVSTAIENFSMLFPAKVAGAYTWKDANTLQLVLRYIESPHTETFTCHFDGNKITIDAARSLDFGRNTMMLHGEAK
ncbi:MAG TPA: hypothetical protein VIH86_05170, partial [Puia sp.]